MHLAHIANSVHTPAPKNRRKWENAREKLIKKRSLFWQGEPVVEMDDEMVQQWQQKFDAQRGGPTEENISKAELRLTDIADTVQGREWIVTYYAYYADIQRSCSTCASYFDVTMVQNITRISICFRRWLGNVGKTVEHHRRWDCEDPGRIYVR